MTTTLINKSREAQELNNRIRWIVDEVRTNNKLTREEFDSFTEEVKVLRKRADRLAGMTPDAEIRRQGGDEGDYDFQAGVERRMVRVDGPGAEVSEDDAAGALGGGTRTMTDEGFGGWNRDIKVLRKKVLRRFGSTAKYLKALRSAEDYHRCTPEQMAVLKEAEMLTRTIIGTAGDTSGGEFLLPLQQDPSVFMVENEEYGLLQSARRYNVSGRTFRIPYVRQTDPNNARPISGIANVTIVGEAQTKPILEPAFAQRLMTMFKYAAAAQIGDETIADDFTGDLQPVVTALVGQQVLNAINENVTATGTGVAMPLGALNTSNPALLVYTRSGGANSQNFAPVDAFTMLSRHTVGPKSCWLCSRRTVIGIYGLALTSGTTGVAWVSFLQDLRGKPGTQLLGLPIMYSDILNTWGTQGDINLVNPDFMAVGLRQTLTVESSIHVAFLQDVTTYRFFARGGGVPIPDGTYAYRASGGSEIDPHSPFVQLQ
jgi:HK97 family phage major capsid protein